MPRAVAPPALTTVDATERAGSGKDPFWDGQSEHRSEFGQEGGDVARDVAHDGRAFGAVDSGSLQSGKGRRKDSRNKP